MLELNKYLEYNTPNDEVKNWVRTVLAARIKKHGENQVEFEHILDFLTSDKASTRLRKMSYEQAKVAAEKWNKTLMKKGAHIDESESDLKVVKKWADGFKFVKLVGPNAFKREGYLMRHCAGSYAERPDTEVYSLRDPLNVPHATIEVVKSGSMINQIKGKGNGPIHPDYIKKVLSILKMFKVEVRGSELQNLGYIKLTDFMYNAIKNEFTGAKFLKVKDGEYFYVGSKIKRIK
jgi:hypothetical protein